MERLLKELEVIVGKIEMVKEIKHFRELTLKVLEETGELSCVGSMSLT